MKAVTVLVMLIALTPFAAAQYRGYLPVQTGGCEQTTVNTQSGQWFTYMLVQRDMDTVVVGYPPQQMLVSDQTCNVECIEWNSGTYRIEITLSGVTQDNIYRWRAETRARYVAQRTTFYDRFVLYNARWSTDIYKAPTFSWRKRWSSTRSKAGRKLGGKQT